MGNTCISMADSCQCMTKTTTICKVISLQLIKKKKKGEIKLLSNLNSGHGVMLCLMV